MKPFNGNGAQDVSMDWPNHTETQEWQHNVRYHSTAWFRLSVYPHLCLTDKTATHKKTLPVHSLRRHYLV